MADERRDPGRSFTDRVGDKVMGNAGGAYEPEAADLRTEAQAPVNDRSESSVAGRYSAERRDNSHAGYEPAPLRDQAPGYRAASFGGSKERSISGLLRDFSRQLGTLVRMEATLAKTEMREKAAIAGRNSASAVIGGVLGLAGAIILLMACAQALSAFMDARGVSPLVYSWLSPLIVSAIVFAVSYFLVKKGLDAIKGANLTPQNTAQSLRETGEWIKEKIA